jgi:hypothetical protein
MMGRVTFQDDRVARRIRKSFVPVWKNVQPGYRVKKIDRAVFEKFGGTTYRPTDPAASEETEDFRRLLAARQPDGQASENVATILATADGSVIHVIPGLFRPGSFARELDVALRLHAELRRAGPDRDRKRDRLRKAHLRRLDSVRRGEVAGALARALLTHVHRRLSDGPVPRVDQIDGVREFSVVTLQQAMAGKVRKLQDEVRKRQGDDRATEAMALMAPFDRYIRELRLDDADALVSQALERVRE